jgi:drug/metabolite transporter (DMT)-like permease
VLWPVFGGAMLIHIVYKVLQAMAYTRGAYTVVYPVVRGTGPLATVTAAGFVFGEHFSAVQWMGVAALSGGILGLAGYNLRHVLIDRVTLVPALLFAAATGVWVAAYTTYDAWGIRLSTDPLVFVFWFFVADGIAFPLIVGFWVRRGRVQLPPFGPLALRGLVGGVMGIGSFGTIMLATRLDKVGEAAVLRETSVVFAAAIGWIFLKESVGPRRLGLMALIALGAVLVEAGG